MKGSIFSLRDLKAWSNGSGCLGVVGHPIEHSLSPSIHNGIYKGLPHPFNLWKYYKFDVTDHELREAFSLFLEKNFVGINVTAPYKYAAMLYADELDELARQSGSVNTLHFYNKKILGYNTDFYGISEAFQSNYGHSLAEKDIIIFGSGGVVGTLLFYLSSQAVKQVSVISRSNERWGFLKSLLDPEFSKKVNFSLIRDIPPQMQNPILIHATSEKNPEFINLNAWKPSFLFDLNYGESGLILAAMKMGIPHCNGLVMLYEQALVSIRIWTNPSSFHNEQLRG